ARCSYDAAAAFSAINNCVVEAGVIKLLRPLVNLLMEEALRVRLRSIALDAQQLEPWLASANIDFAMGSFPGLTKAVRRQFLWTESYVGVVRRGHPRLRRRPSLAAFRAEQHVLVSALGTGHAHALAERALESAVGADNIVCRVPMFI